MSKSFIIIALCAVLSFSCSSVSPVRSSSVYTKPELKTPVSTEVENPTIDYKQLTCQDLDKIARMTSLALQYVINKEFTSANEIIIQNLNELIGVKGRDEYWIALNYLYLSYLYHGMDDKLNAEIYANNALQIFEQVLNARHDNTVYLVKKWIAFLGTNQKLFSKNTANNYKTEKLNENENYGAIPGPPKNNGEDKYIEILKQMKDILEKMKDLIDKTSLSNKN